MEKMGNAAEPQTDRELLLKLNSEINRLSLSIDSFSKTLQYIEDKKIAALEERILQLEGWKQQISGGWKVAAALWFVITGSFFVWLRSKI